MDWGRRNITVWFVYGVADMFQSGSNDDSVILQRLIRLVEDSDDAIIGEPGPKVEVISG